MVVIVCLIFLLIGAVVTDLKEHKIRNNWVFAWCIAGMIVRSISNWPFGLFAAAVTVAFAFIILFPVYLIGGIGAGDVKLFAACAAWMDVRETMLCILCSFVIAGVFSLCLMIAARKRIHTIRFAIPVMMSVLYIFGGKL